MNLLEKTLQSVETLKHMGLRVLINTPNTLKLEMPLDGNKNHMGTAYAGAIFTLAEVPFGLMCIERFGTHEIVPAVGEVTIRFTAPATGALTVEIHISDEEWAEIEQQTRTKGKYKIAREIEVRDSQGRVNTIARATYFTLAVKK